MADYALASTETLPEQMIWWDGYQQALTDIERPPPHAEDPGDYDPLVKVQAGLWRPRA
jgi:hypothetical protein